MMWVCLLYISVGTFRVWRMDRTEYSEGKFLKQVDQLKLTLSVVFGIYWQWEDSRRPQINLSSGNWCWPNVALANLKKPAARFWAIESRIGIVYPTAKFSGLIVGAKCSQEGQLGALLSPRYTKSTNCWMLRFSRRSSQALDLKTWRTFWRARSRSTRRRRGVMSVVTCMHAKNELVEDALGQENEDELE